MNVTPYKSFKFKFLSAVMRKLKYGIFVASGGFIIYYSITAKD